MSTAATEEPDTPLIPQPANTPEALRAAIAKVMPASLTTFDAERVEALREARSTGNAGPMRRLVGQWAVYVAIERHPRRAARLRELEAISAVTESLDEARATASEIGRMLDQASAEVGLNRGTATA
ncbi:hypothetical protein QZH56_20435 [Streptomyces olivoreticuli]|uniref:DUF6247 family protein n=1 Tax=Streptomyces olivoreticuli TaxID=68246 RepID=UPI00265A7F87|nr:DUF6247 family protein [Streptomyces olivoreticuli]WKK21234.1 hypothetical protein QZH56_20435 [Streptomyces olivoreticuli]